MPAPRLPDFTLLATLAGMIAGTSFLGSSAPALADPFFIPPTEIERIAHSDEWQRLLHFRKPVLGAARSDVDQKTFFLAPNGRTSPEDELRATLQLTLDREGARTLYGTLQQPGICAFPARLDFLKRALGPTFARSVVEVDCTAFDEWRRAISAKGVSVIFSSAYPGNPASMFGHTLLRLDRDPLSPRQDLLSYGVNFSASVPPNENPVKYALWGLTGGYRGRYDLAPYYQKVNEYAFSESRDLWEYRLALTPDETDQLVRHLWELYSEGFFDYFFLDENCSFQILTALEAIRPDWKLSSGFFLSVLPVETIKHLTRSPGIVSEVHLRPALRKRMMESVSRLSRTERARVLALHRADATPGTSDPSAVLDALILTLTHEKQSENFPAKRSALLQQVLRLRASQGATAIPPLSVLPADQNPYRPDHAHPSSRFAVRGGRRGHENFTSVSISGLEHDFMDRTAAFNPFSEVRILKLELQKFRQVQWTLTDFTAIAMSSFAPDSPFAQQHSWRISTGWTRPGDLRKPDGASGSGGAWNARGGYGAGKEFISAGNLAYALLAGEAEAGSALKKGFRLSPGFEAGLLFQPVPDFLFFHFFVEGLWDATASEARRKRWNLGMNASYAWTRRLSLRVQSRRESQSFGDSKPQSEFAGGFNWMF